MWGYPVLILLFFAAMASLIAMASTIEVIASTLEAMASQPLQDLACFFNLLLRASTEGMRAPSILQEIAGAAFSTKWSRQEFFALA